MSIDAAVASIIASIVSVFVGLVAIALAVYFYTQSKTTEIKVSSALASIKAQTGTLEKLTGRHMDRLIKGITEPRATKESLSAVMAAIQELPGSISSHLQVPAQALITEVVTSYITTFYYVGIANVLSQPSLPTDPEMDNPVKELVDQTYSDFYYMEALLAKASPAELQTNRLAHLYEYAQQQWKPFVRNAAMVYQQRGDATERAE